MLADVPEERLDVTGPAGQGLPPVSHNPQRGHLPPAHPAGRDRGLQAGQPDVQVE